VKHGVVLGEMNGETIQAGTVEKVVNNVLAKIGVAAAENSTSTTAKTNSTENTGAAKHNVTGDEHKQVESPLLQLACTLVVLRLCYLCCVHPCAP